eukprot:CAMPEP_0116139720 /NCGR_PEP_ID=MMETSP0329-20121206/13461_1 /TAXON_ID=697910 /ORGANISM="Pseudo-nitzschia arenysensis, Strain B593" /LENGTH=221 /DNA_ID=CAMNT_0003634779 /DNA_START=369 /DNA_END=1034 /DNA_ORIENTATION=+
MSETEVNGLNGEKDCCKNGSYPQASRNKNGSKPRKSMDVEHHAHLDEDIDHSNGSRKIIYDRPSEEFVKKIELTEIIDFDSDEDTFADAESDCEPNQFFLDEMLEDEHPERLNLFDYRKKEQDKGGSSSTLSSSDTQNENVIEDSSTSGHDDDGDDQIIRNLNIDDSESSADPLDGNNDSVSNLPTIRKKGRGRLSMGTSPGVGPGRAMLRQASQKAVWGE